MRVHEDCAEGAMEDGGVEGCALTPSYESTGIIANC